MASGMMTTMTSRHGIINQALLLLGQDLVADPQAGSVTARLAASVYDDALAETLAMHPWSFALRATTLQRRMGPPTDRRFANAFALPADMARIVQVEHVGQHPDAHTDLFAAANSLPVAAYTVQGQSLLCDAAEVQLLYVPAAVDEALMPPAFRMLLAHQLALRLAYKLTGDAALVRQLVQRLPAVRQEAVHNDGEQTSTLPENRPNLLVAIREY